MHVLVHGDVARPHGGRAVIERYRNARPARVVRPGLHGRAVQRNGRRLRPATEREDIPRRAGDRHRLRIPLRDHPLARQVQRVRVQSPAGLPAAFSTFTAPSVPVVAVPVHVPEMSAALCYTILFPLCATRIPPLYTSISSGNTGASSQHDLGEKDPASPDSVRYGI